GDRAPRTPARANRPRAPRAGGSRRCRNHMRRPSRSRSAGGHPVRSSSRGSGSAGVWRHGRRRSRAGRRDGDKRCAGRATRHRRREPAAAARRRCRLRRDHRSGQAGRHAQTTAIHARKLRGGRIRSFRPPHRNMRAAPRRVPVVAARCHGRRWKRAASFLGSFASSRSSHWLNGRTVSIKASARRVADTHCIRGYPRMSAQPQPTGYRRAGDAGSNYRRVRDATLALCATLAPEDTVVQSMPDASPAKWHLAHTTWFFEQFLLAHFDPAYRRFHAGWDYLFNSYYQTAGPMHARPQRGLLTRPTLDEVVAYRAHVDDAMAGLLASRGDDREVMKRAALGLNHEQQHQELLLTDIQHLFSLNPLQPMFREAPAAQESGAVALQFIAGPDGVVEIGHAGDGFAYDNESPRHRELLHPHAIANRCVTNAEFREFIDDGGYRDPAVWLSEGWDTVRRDGWLHPLYWDDALETSFTLAGRRAIDPAAPVCHVNFF